MRRRRMIHASCVLVADASGALRSYIFLLFKQPAEMGAKGAQQAAPPERNSFDVRSFAKAHKLEGPVGVAYFEAEKPAARHKEH